MSTPTELEIDDVGLVIVRDGFWKEKTVIVNGYHFVNCVFEKCEIKTHEMGTFRMTFCKVIP